MVAVEQFRMLEIGGVRYRPEDALRLGLVDAADLEPAPAPAPVEAVPEHVITSATAVEVSHAGPDPDADPAGAVEPARATPARQRGKPRGK